MRHGCARPTPTVRLGQPFHGHFQSLFELFFGRVSACFALCLFWSRSILGVCHATSSRSGLRFGLTLVWMLAAGAEGTARAPWGDAHRPVRLNPHFFPLFSLMFWAVGHLTTCGATCSGALSLGCRCASRSANLPAHVWLTFDSPLAHASVTLAAQHSRDGFASSDFARIAAPTSERPLADVSHQNGQLYGRRTLTCNLTVDCGL